MIYSPFQKFSLCELSSVGPAAFSVFNWSRFRTENWILLLYFYYSRWYFSISAVSLKSVNIWRVDSLMWLPIKNGGNETENKPVFVFCCWRVCHQQILIVGTIFLIIRPSVSFLNTSWLLYTDSSFHLHDAFNVCYRHEMMQRFFPQRLHFFTNKRVHRCT